MVLSRRQKGDQGVAETLAFYVSRGWSVLIPFGESQRYDLVVDRGRGLERVQCKMAPSLNKYGSYCAELRTKGGRGNNQTTKFISSSEVDVVVVVGGDGSIWEFPAHKLEGKSSICLCPKNSQYNVLSLDVKGA